MENFDDLFAPQPAQREDTHFDKEAWATRKQQERNQVYDLIDTYAHDMSSTEGLNFANAFQTYLDVQARFDRYSVSNAINITCFPSWEQLSKERAANRGTLFPVFFLRHYFILPFQGGGVSFHFDAKQAGRAHDKP